MLNFKSYSEAKPQSWDFWHADFVPKGCITLLVGEGGSGKSTFMSWLADNICKNGCRVAIMSNEEELKKLTARANPTTNVKFLSRFDRENNEKITTEDVIEALNLFDVVFVDSFITICPIDCRYAQQVEKAFDPFIKAVSGTNKSIVFLHHPNKNGGDSLQSMVAGSERMVSIVRHCNLTVNDRIEDRRIITVAKSNCFSTDKNHSFIICPTDRTLSDGGIIKVVDYLVPFTEDLEEVLWRNSKKGKEFLYKRKVYNQSQNNEQIYSYQSIPKIIKDVLKESKGQFVDREFLDSMGKNTYTYFSSAVKKTGEKWVTKERNGAKVIYHWTDEALEWLENH